MWTRRLKIIDCQTIKMKDILKHELYLKPSFTLKISTHKDQSSTLLWPYCCISISLFSQIQKIPNDRWTINQGMIYQTKITEIATEINYPIKKGCERTSASMIKHHINSKIEIFKSRSTPLNSFLFILHSIAITNYFCSSQLKAYQYFPIILS